MPAEHTTSGFGATVRKELLTTWRDRRLTGALGLVVALYVAALALGWRAHQRAHAEYAAARAIAREEWLSQGARNPHDAGHWGTFAFKPPHPLGVVERGAGDYMGDWVRLETHTQNDPQHRRAKDATGYFRLGAFTPLTVVSLFLPLVLLIVTHASVCGEDEYGTAALLRSTGVSAAALGRGKVVAALLFALGWLAPLLVGSGAVILLAEGGVDGTRAAATGVATAVVLYCAVFTLLGVAVSAASRTPRQALAVGFAAWALLCVVAPRLAASAAEAAAPAPSAFAFKQALEGEREGKWTIPYRARGNFMALYGEIERRLMGEARVTSADSLTVDPFGLAIEATEEEGQRAYDASFRAVLERFRRQDAIRRWFAVVTPQVALRGVTASLAHADLAGHLAFVDAAEAYRRELMRTLNLDIAYNARRAGRAPGPGGTSYIRAYERGADFWRTFPEFQPPARPPAAALAAVAPEVVALVGWVALGIVATRWAVRRRWGR